MNRILPIIILLLTLTSCHSIEEWENDPRGNFEALWTILDEHYCFFEEKGIDWNGIHDRYSARISDRMTREELFETCSQMLGELRDGHVNLSAPFNTYYYRRWWSDYPQNYSSRLVEQYYFNFNYRSLGGIDYGILPQNIGYMHYSSFSYAIGEGNLDEIMLYFATCTGLIIDVRDNGGGDLTNVETLVRRFITDRILAGYISHKTGPGHDEFSKPRPFHYDPAGAGRQMWGKPVVVLTNRSTFSAANNFVSIMKSLPLVTVAGATTGGGSGMPYSSELPCGWAVRMSACSILDPEGNTTETGIAPTEGCAIDLDPVAALDGHDTMLDFAIARLLQVQ